MRTIIMCLFLAACSNGKAAPSSPSTGCDEQVARAMDRYFGLYDAFLARLETIDWAKECKQLVSDLEAVAPTAATFFEDSKAFERETRADQQCGTAIVEASNRDPRGKAVAVRMERTIKAAERAEERCRDTPGWRNASEPILLALAGGAAY